MTRRPEEITTWLGTFPSLTDAARAHGVDPTTMSLARRDGRLDRVGKGTGRNADRYRHALRTILAISQDGKGWAKDRMAEVAAQALGQEGTK